MDEVHGTALERRGLDVELAVRLGWRPCRGPTDDLWIAIPYIDGGKRVGTKYRTLSGEKQFVQQAGTPQIFYNIDALRDPELAGYPVVITEGEMDALVALQAGYPRTVSVPGGAPARDDADDGARWHCLSHAKSWLAKARPIVLAVDNDANGTVLRDGLAKRLGRSKCQILEYPTGKDLNDVLMAQGTAAVRRTLAQASYLPISGLSRLHEIEEPPRREVRDVLVPGLEKHWRLRRGDFCVITGPPGHGKSSFIANVCCNMAYHWHETTAIASFEQQVVPDLRRTLRTFRSECLEKYMGDQQKMVADQWIDQNFVFIQNPSEEEMTLDWLLERFAAAIHRFGASICVIDPWNEVSIADKPIEWTTEQFVSQSLRAIKKFAHMNNVAFIVVAHPRKLGRDRNGKIPKPGLWDIADSAAWANRADVGIVIYRPSLDPGTLTEISIEKSRDFYEIGITGSVSLKWEAETSRYVQPLR